MADNGEKVPIRGRDPSSALDDVIAGLAQQAATQALVNFSTALNQTATDLARAGNVLQNATTNPPAAPQASRDRGASPPGSTPEATPADQQKAPWYARLSRAGANIKSGNLRGVSASAKQGSAGSSTASGLGTSFTIVAAAATLAAATLNRMSQAQQSYMQTLAQFSPGQAAIQGEVRLRETVRTREVGDRTTASAHALMRAEQAKQDGMKELDVMITNFKNKAASVWEQFKMIVVAPLNGMAKDINKWMGNRGPDDRSRPISLGEWMGDVRNEMEKIDKHDHPKFRHPRID